MDLNASPRLLEHLRMEALDTRLLVYDPNGGMVVELNQTGGLVLQLCDGARSVADISAALADAYPQAAAEVGPDVERIIEGLVEKGVLEWA